MARVDWYIERHDAIPSTQDALRERLECGASINGLVIRANLQTSGRGRRGRAWVSGRGGSYQSVAVQDSDTPRLRSSRAPLAVAIGIAESLARLGVPVGLKWPNDLYLGRGKLGGILCEHSRGHLLVGVGVNVANGIPPGAARLEGWGVEEASDAVLEGIDEGLSRWLQAPELGRRFARFDVLSGRELRVETGSLELLGTAVGIDDHGCLRLEIDGAVQSLCTARIVTIAGWPEYGAARRDPPRTSDPRGEPG